MADPPSKRKRGRPRLPDDERRVAVGVMLQPALYDAIIRRAQHEGESVSSVLRKDLELVEAWRQRRRERP